MKRLIAATLPLALAACGVIPLPSQRIGDFEVTLPPSRPDASIVVYTKENRFADTTIPTVFSRVQLSGNAVYSGLGTVSRADVYVRPSLPSATEACQDLGAYFVCDATAETANRIGSLTLGANRSGLFSLGGPSLDVAAKNRQGYFGVRLLEGESWLFDKLLLRNVTASARL
ncbi:hypothetical protein [Deinococcus yavapaiensis]|uniref:Lipoprotein n=1 Tax=Deinococcus yavapaiensis KR-236 TaxID=694435 RepID=A0A318S8S7_9DEIO|nr:hypothetical protein [Deinococcus yavapaiensis]PYE54935.1 hypothetical protein DES52_104209 [Deinococcus yavapaiensis KR-236]